MDIYLGSDQLNNDKRFILGDKGLFAPNFAFTAAPNGGRHGRTLSKSYSRSYTFATEWLLVGDDFSDLENQKEAFAYLLDEILAQGVKDLRLDKPNGKSVFLPVKSFRITGTNSPDNGVSCPLLVEFESEYPFLRSITEDIDEINIFSGGGFAVPFAIPLAMNVGGSAEKIVANDGNHEAYPMITFYGDMTNPTLTNQTTGKSMSLTATLAASTDYIFVDTYLHTVVQFPSGNSVRDDFAGDFFTLAKGNNALKLTASSGASGKAVVVHKDHYVGK